ncbi:MAG TPA: peptidoglycan-associated lipoprotein Pal [Thermoanaerobaculia bacterium]|jgi:peptidoglycan-associated lipoprotein|nr:peptidoglycan-associated lipoprotein Pal [Thermoanaerobaculia bacterium]
MNRSLQSMAIVLCCLAAAACRHNQKVAPKVAPAAESAPVTSVESPANDFKTPEPAVVPEPAPEMSLRDAFFDFDSSTLGDNARANLSDSAGWIKSHPNDSLLIEGHCDERGTEQYNLALGERRAWEAKSYLAVLGIDTSRIKTISYGKDRPFAPGHDEDAWAQNRRAHLVVTP